MNFKLHKQLCKDHILKMFVVASPFVYVYISPSRSYSHNSRFQRWRQQETEDRLEKTTLANKHFQVFIFANILGEYKLDVYQALGSNSRKIG